MLSIQLWKYLTNKKNIPISPCQSITIQTFLAKLGRPGVVKPAVLVAKSVGGGHAKYPTLLHPLACYPKVDPGNCDKGAKFYSFLLGVRVASKRFYVVSR